eukprot:NODE_650_length_5546_cov_0.463558.p2 type:complete len:485 gc:universal NODE_650_length_5546_cov_0.463558:3545-4999(+)
MKNKISQVKKSRKRPNIEVLLPTEDVINVEKYIALRGTEVKMMELAMRQSELLKVRLPEQKLPHHLRRRANTYNEKKKRFPNKIRNFKNRKNNENSKWMETHLWHAKRMKMNNLFGFKIALKPTLKCHKAIIKSSKHGCCINDKSYYKVVQVTSEIEKFKSKHLNSVNHDSNVYFLVNVHKELVGEISSLESGHTLILIAHPEIMGELHCILAEYEHSVLELGVFDLYGQQSTIYCKSVLLPTTNTSFTELTSFPSCLLGHFFNFDADISFPPVRLPLDDFSQFRDTKSDKELITSHFTVANTSWYQMNRLTILVPKPKIKSLWRSFIFCGVYACGLENVHTIYFEHKLPCYPFDYVNTGGYNTIHSILSNNLLQVWNKKAPIHKTRAPEFNEMQGKIATPLHELTKNPNMLYWCFLTLYKGNAKYHDKITNDGEVIGFVTTCQFNQTVGRTCCIGIVNVALDSIDVHVESGDGFAVAKLELID